MTEKKGPIDEILEDLRARRGEVEMQIGLAKGEARRRWEDLEGRFEELKIKAEVAGSVASDTAENVSDALEIAAEELREGYAKLKKLL